MDMIEIVKQKKSWQKRQWEQIPAPASHPSSVWVDKGGKSSQGCVYNVYISYIQG